MLRHAAAFVICVFAASAAAPVLAGGWAPAERVETYAVQGATGLELYRSIGARGPEIGGTRTIAYTTFDLKWSRDYRPQPDGSCRLVAARPHLTIITKLPKPAGKLAPALEARWQTFIDGIAAHERYHAETILDMVKAIEAYSVGLAIADDGKCRKIREVLTRRLGELSQEQRARGRDFDRVEMSAGGNVHRLILGLIE